MSDKNSPRGVVSNQGAEENTEDGISDVIISTAAYKIVDGDIISSTPPPGPKAHKDMARRLGIKRNSAAELYVLAANNDPFYKGTPGHYRNAEWFAGIWEQFGNSRGVHLRRVHYQILSNELEFADGTAYENTEKYWDGLCDASAAARILGLVDVEAFADRRNPDPVINRTERKTPLWSPWVSFRRASLTLRA